MVLKSVLKQVKKAIVGGTGSAGDGTEVDVLVIGGGVQGLTLLNELTERGYGTALVTHSPIGQGQSLHWHGVLSSGYTNPHPEVRNSVKEDWLPYLDDLGVSTYGNEDWYVLATEKPYQKLTRSWEKHDYPYEETELDELPAKYSDGDFFGDETELHVLGIDEHCVDKRELVEKLVSGYEGRVIVGDVTEYGFSEGASDPVVETVNIRTCSNSDITLDPDYVVSATGTGTHGLFESMISTDGFREAGGNQRQVRDSLDDVTYKNVHMLTIRGPADELPEISAYIPPKKMKVVSHRHEIEGEDYVTYYVTNKPLSNVEPQDSPDGGRGTVDSEHVAEGFNKLFGLLPALREEASEPGSSIEFCVYAGVKQFIGDQPNTPYADPVNGIENVGVALPSVMSAVHLSTEEMLEEVSDKITPNGPINQVPGAGNPTIGKVTERREDTDWLNWNELIETYPGIKQPTTQ